MTIAWWNNVDFSVAVSDVDNVDFSAIRWWQVRSGGAGGEVTDKRLRSNGERDFTPLQGARG